MVPASYVYLLREVDGATEVLLQLRQGTPYMDGHWAAAAAGHVEAFTPPGDIHVVRPEGDGVAVSLHVYGTDVTRTGSSVRRIYAL